MKPTTHKIYVGGAETMLKKLSDNFFQLMVTSPPYWNVRDYGHKDQIGLKDTLEQYLKRLNIVWKEVIRVLLPDGKIALNIGNIYYSEPDEKRRTTANLSLLTWQQLSNFKELRFMGTIYWQKTTSRDGSVLFGSYPYPTNFMISNAVEPIHIFRKVGKYVEMWNIPNDVARVLKLFTGEIKPEQTGLKDRRRMFLSEMIRNDQNKIVDFFTKNKILIVSDILKGNDEFPVGWMLVVLNIFGSSDVRITDRGSLKIGKITMQRKGGDAGKETSKMLQFKINPMELFY